MGQSVTQLISIKTLLTQHVGRWDLLVPLTTLEWNTRKKLLLLILFISLVFSVDQDSIRIEPHK